MPEPITAAEGEQGVETATAPQQTATDKPETTTQSEGQSQSNARSVMDFLDIPPELREQIEPKAEQPEAKPDEETPEPEAEKPEVEKPEEVEAKKDEDEDDDDDDEVVSEDKEKEEEKPAEQKIDKRQKRINRLTRQKSELAEQLDTASTQITELREKLERFEKNGQAPVGTVPQVGPWLPDQETAETYKDLSQKKAVAEATLSWCDKYSQGVTITENGQERFVAPEEILEQRRKAEVTLMDVNPDLKVIEHTSKQMFKQQQSEFDKIAYHFWPELSKKETPEYQEYAKITREFPTVAASPAARYYIGLAIEGRKAIEARIAAAKNGSSPQKKHRDISEKVFTTPRVPIAPHTPEPPTRESVPSSQKRLNEAQNSLMADPDGSAESLAKVFQAREEVGRKLNSRTPVKS